MRPSDVEGGFEEVKTGGRETSQGAMVHIRKDAGLTVPRNCCSERSQCQDWNSYLQTPTPLSPIGRILAQQAYVLFKAQSLLENKVIWIYTTMKNTCRNSLLYFKGFLLFQRMV